MNWLEYIRGVIPAHRAGALAVGVTKCSKEFLEKHFTRILVATDKDKTSWCNYEKDILSVGEYLLEKLKDESFKEKYFAEYNKIWKDMITKCQELRKKDFAQWTDEELLKNYENFLYQSHKNYALVFDIDGIDVVLEEKMRKKLKEIMKNFSSSEFNLKYTILTTPIDVPYINKEELMLYEAALEAKKSGRINKDELKKIVDKYWWTSLGWDSRQENDEKKYAEKIRSLLKENINFDKEIEKIMKRKTGMTKQKKDLKEEISFDKEMDYYLEVFEIYAVLHDYRKEMQMKSISCFDKFLDEIARRVKRTYEELMWLYPEEIILLLEGKEAPFGLIEKRKEDSLTIFTYGEKQEFLGEEAAEKKRKELFAESEKVSDFSGIIGSKGNKTGNVKICFSAKDAAKNIEQGDILVTGMTTPEFVPSMKKAAAIVTDEGGLTCHAAIIARELGIPCIIGTKIATKVLKDGDLVEVKGNHGIVKILKRKE